MAAGGTASGAAAAAAHGAAAAAAGGINPPSIAGHDMMWKHIMSGGQWHWAPWWHDMSIFSPWKRARWSDDTIASRHHAQYPEASPFIFICFHPSIFFNINSTDISPKCPEKIAPKILPKFATKSYYNISSKFVQKTLLKYFSL